MAARNPTPVGEKFNRLTIISDAPKHSSNKNRRVFAKCECGIVKDYVLSEVRLGKTKSCGCLSKENTAAVTHGHTRKKFSPEYYSWSSMKTRCLNHNFWAYSEYGGRGIKICERWHVFENFLEDMGPRADGMTLERLNVDGDYEPDNCVWSSRKKQSNNTRRNSIFEYDGRRQTVAEWASEFGLAYNTLLARLIRLKWPIERALKTPPGPSYKR